MKVRVTSAIKFGGKIHPEGAVIDIPEKMLRAGLHVEPVAAEEQRQAPDDGNKGGKPDDGNKGGKPDDNKGKK